MTSLSVIMDMNDDEIPRDIHKDGPSPGRPYPARSSSAAQLKQPTQELPRTSPRPSNSEAQDNNRRQLKRSYIGPLPPSSDPGAVLTTPMPLPQHQVVRETEAMSRHGYGSSDLKMRSSMGPESSVKLTPITKRISRAKKGVPVHVCELCKPPKASNGSPIFSEFPEFFLFIVMSLMKFFQLISIICKIDLHKSRAPEVSFQVWPLIAGMNITFPFLGLFLQQ